MSGGRLPGGGPAGRAATAEPRRLRLVVFVPSFGEGGVERMLVNTAAGLAARGLAVDFWVGTSRAPFLDRLPATVRLLKHEPASSWRRLHAFRSYLFEHRPDVVLAAKDPAVGMALRARRWSGVPCRVVARPGTVSDRLSRRLPWLRWRDRRAMRLAYRGADLVVANSAGLARDIAAVAGLPVESVPVVRNPVVTPDLERLAAAPTGHPWFAPGEPPVVLGAGAFRRQKDFETLIRAFARVRAEREARLVILGRGRLEGALRDLTRDLGLERAVDFPGFVNNPYPFMRGAAVFALSSRWEGSPNVLTEALAVGTPAVSTDCPSGPREILQDGRVGPLVPVGDPEALGRAILATLSSPRAPDVLRSAVREYTVAECAARYEALLQALVSARPGGPDAR